MSDEQKNKIVIGTIIAVIVIVIIVIVGTVIVVARADDSAASTDEEPFFENPATITYPETFQVPSEGDLKKELTSHTWNALVATFNTPGVVTSASRTSATAVFAHDNGTDMIMEITWLTDSQELTLYDWDLNSSMDGYTAKWKNSNGDVRYVSFIPRGHGRIDISVYGEENALTRFIVITKPDA